jgi:glutathione S-transferase
MADIIFYTNPRSRGQLIRYMLEELGEPYETVLLEYETSMKSPDYLAINPMGKVPAITHKGTVVTECAAICAYLADAYPGAMLAPPPQDPRRGPYYRWLFFGAGPLEAAVTAKAMGLLAPAERKAMVGYGSFEDTMAALETAVAGREYICGDLFTAADIYVGSQISWGLMFNTIPDRPAFREYAARIEERPAFKRAREIDVAAMPKEPA